MRKQRLDNWIGIALAITTGVVFIVIGVPLMQRKIAPNRIYGYRTKTTLCDPDIWYEVNAVTGKQLVILGVVLVAMGVVGLAARNDPRQQEMLVWASLAAMAIGLVYSVYSGHMLSKELSKEP